MNADMCLGGTARRHHHSWRCGLLALVFVLTIPADALAAWTGDLSWRIWALPAAGGSTRWLVVHASEVVASERIYHIEVLELAPKAAAWQVRHLANHMAVTEAALRASVVKPRKSGEVYPESFDYAYAAWKKQNAEGKAPVCRSTVAECL